MYLQKYFEYRRLRGLQRYHETETDLFGKKIKIADARTFVLGYNEIFQKGIYEFLPLNVNEINIIDCGANIGLSVLYFKRFYPNAKIVAFEPDGNLCNILRHNVKVFDFNDVEIFQKAVWINDLGVDFMVEGAFSGRIPKAGDINNITRVPSVRLKELLNSKVSFLKMDIEGAETKVIEDCNENLGNVDFIFIEYHSHISEPQELDKILQILHDNGFRYQIHEAYTAPKPFVKITPLLGMDLQLNMYAYKY